LKSYFGKTLHLDNNKKKKPMTLIQSVFFGGRPKVAIFQGIVFLFPYLNNRIYLAYVMICFPIYPNKDLELNGHWSLQMF
jgi:hypothetical protein